MVKVVWSKTAIRNRNEIFKYWNSNNQSTAYSLKLRRLIGEAINTITAFPQIGKPTDRLDTRVEIILHYFLIYRIDGNRIRILDFWDSRQDPLKLEIIIE